MSTGVLRVTVMLTTFQVLLILWEEVRQGETGGRFYPDMVVPAEVLSLCAQRTETG